jgi:hypothetical protein
VSELPTADRTPFDPLTIELLGSNFDHEFQVEFESRRLPCLLSINHDNIYFLQAEKGINNRHNYFVI